MRSVVFFLLLVLAIGSGTLVVVLMSPDLPLEARAPFGVLGFSITLLVSAIALLEDSRVASLEQRVAQLEKEKP